MIYTPVFSKEDLVPTLTKWARSVFIELTKVRRITASATIDFASIAAGAIGTATISAPGVQVGDFVTLSAPSTLEAGLMFCGLVTAADTVTIRLHNTTGAAIDPASATWKCTVTNHA